MHIYLLIYFNNLYSKYFEESNSSSSEGSLLYKQYMVFIIYLRWLTASTIRVELLMMNS